MSVGVHTLKIKNQKSATETCHACLSLCRRAVRIYEEIQKIEANEFRYQEQVRSGARPSPVGLEPTAVMTRDLSSPSPRQIDPIEYVEDLCENMQLFPKEDFLTGDQLMFDFKPDVSRRGREDGAVWG